MSRVTTVPVGQPTVAIWGAVEVFDHSKQLVAFASLHARSSPLGVIRGIACP